MVVPAQKSDRYAAIKKLCCIESPVPSQERAHHTFSQIIGLLKVGKFQNEFMQSSFLPKYEPKMVRISAL
jgi:hypothetical protein